jgi:integral membrane protein (TIGR01906 family)
VNPGPARTTLGLLVGLTTMITIVALALLVFLNPAWVALEQDRTGAAAFTGFSRATVHTVTNSMLHDMAFGPPNFAVAVNGQEVLGVRERAHMVDVRNVFLAFGGLALLAVLALVSIGIFARGAAWFPRAMRLGAIVLAVVVVVLGVVATVAFDALFQTFHQLFFPPGSFDFDASSKLIQLFPDQFWFETSLILGIVILAVCGVVAALAGRGARASQPGPAAGGPRTA